MKTAVVLLEHPGNKGSLARAVNALELVKEAGLSGDDIQLIVDGAGTMWIPELSNPNHKYHSLFAEVEDRITAVCDYCAGVFDVRDKVQDLGYPLISEFDGHPSLRSYLVDGYQVITF